MLRSRERPSRGGIAYARSTIHYRQRRRTADSGLVDRGCQPRPLCWWSTTSGWFCPTQQHHVPPLGFRIYFNLSWGLLAALYFLMVGYVSKDAPRRAMSSRFWMLICFVMPGGIGAVLYFLLRQPEVSRCPPAPRMCRATSLLPAVRLPADGQLRQLLPTVRATDQFCTRCGHELATDHMPARLRVLGE